MEGLNEANLNIAGLTSSCKKLERQAKEAAANRLHSMLYCILCININATNVNLV